MPDVRQVQVTFDCADPAALSGFWREVLGYVEEPPPAGHASWEEALEAFGVPKEDWNSRSACRDPQGVGPRLFFQRVPEGKSAKNRVHLDVRAAPGLTGEERMAALEAECTRLAALGATRVRRFEPDSSPGEAGFVVMQDPEGNEFCLD
ncbi:MAG TPA: VOC family protein [Nocardioidaceae bacterium]|nr:VOC family protein [Nocardioidaceae bacterium]